MLFLLCLLGMSSDVRADQLQQIRHSITTLEPATSVADSLLVAMVVDKWSRAYKLNWKLMIAILAQESSFRTDPQKCLYKKRQCSDLGIAQINYNSWKDELSLDHNKLLVDVHYNIENMAKILSKLQVRYGHEKMWWSRYHSATREHRLSYQRKIASKLRQDCRK